MKTLYIHGLDSSPRPEKIKLLEKLNLEVVALHIDYRKEQGQAYYRLLQFAQQEQVAYIIGSSLGGLMGYWLAKDLGVPCLLFNPAMMMQEQLAGLSLNEAGVCPNRHVVLGSLDKSVDPEANAAFFSTLALANTQQRVITCQWLAHGIDLETFETMTAWSVHQLHLATH